MTEYATSINVHYGPGGLAEAILGGLRAVGKDLDALTPDDLAPVDQFHNRGKEATLELVRLAGLAPDMTVLDAGGGIGGPARTLAAEVGCCVTVLDLTEEFCRVGEMLTSLTGLSERVTFRHGSALDMPFGNGSFDVVWTQHSTMNIAGKEQLYAEVHRVLRPGGRLAMHEVMAGESGPVTFPVPWAGDASISFLRQPEEMRTLLRAAGFRELVWHDVTGATLAWWQARRAAAAVESSPPPLGLHLLMGPDFGRMARNMVAGFEQGALAVIQAVLERA
jgi:SAM-dependent methyltransferase